ncbi:MAG TPA: universal stress protein [Gaiellaceae bacterium]|nr:universal stress protein [Gaiellaceae bacterium]
MRLRRRSEGLGPVRRILVGTDRSPTATRAVRWAADMAERYEAELIVCQSVREGMDKATTQSELAEYVADVVGTDARALAAQGNDPARVMIETAKEENVDVIVVGSVGMSGRKEFLLENVPNRVSHNAPCTVVIVQTHLEDGKR